MAYVVDTNVAVVANGLSEQADPVCVIACIDALENIQDNGMIILDENGLILQEYRHNLNPSGQPGAGDYFFKWIWNIQADERYCQLVRITPGLTDPDSFEEFPKDERLQTFDPNDRKFVAVALSSNRSPEILNAVDSDWAEHYQALSEAGIMLRFLCPQHVFPRR
jgi:hypothetical protein